MRDRWLEAFHENPQVAVSDLFTGRAGVGSDMRLDVPELLYQWFPPHLADDRGCLDDALLSWLHDMRDDYASFVPRIGFPVYGKRVGDALIALQLLDLPRAREAIRSDLDAWLRWLSPLRLASERDPALECYRLLTRGQPDARHTAMWLRLATDCRPEYLTVALAGLQLLPNGGDARKNQVLMLQALLRHAATTHHDVEVAREFFNRRFAALRALFPRSPQHWDPALEDALDSYSAYVQTQVAKDLADDLRERPRSKLKLSSSGRSSSSLPNKEDTAGVAALVAMQAAAQSLDTLFSLLEYYHADALATGDSHVFLETLWLVRRQLSADDQTRFGVMVERALAWEPSNHDWWMLWAQCFQVQGRVEAQEAILREMLRMFPSDAVANRELANLLFTRGEEYRSEAEHYFRRAGHYFRRAGHYFRRAENQQDHVGMTVLDFEILQSFSIRKPDNPSMSKVLRGLDVDTHFRAARQFDDSPDDWHQEQISHGYSPTTATNGALQEVIRRGRLAAEFSRALLVGHTNAVQTIKQESLKGDALAGFYSQWLTLEDTPTCPPHAWAWNACQHWRQPASADWEELATRFPEAAPETDFLRALARPDPSSGPGWQERYSAGNGTAPRPVDALMREQRELLEATDLDQRKRDDVACKIMACAAANAPEFAAAESSNFITRAEHSVLRQPTSLESQTGQ